MVVLWWLMVVLVVVVASGGYGVFGFSSMSLLFRGFSNTC
jgi:hypothetical protein